eukprot:2194322-Rhodomonas_salina.1
MHLTYLLQHSLPKSSNHTAPAHASHSHPPAPPSLFFYRHSSKRCVSGKEISTRPFQLVTSTICLRMRSAVPGTNIGYGPTRSRAASGSARLSAAG